MLGAHISVVYLGNTTISSGQLVRVNLGNHKMCRPLKNIYVYVHILIEGTHVEGNHLYEMYPAVVFVKEILPCFWPMSK